ncbi:hypothetical protein TNCV_1037861 [Trichonephila clavipes]|nr:hypothetical protein TNCV_1037861 [Trichonephila clavipes]
MCWTKPSNCDADLSSLDVEGNDGANRTHLVAPRSQSGVHCPQLETICAANYAMNGGHEQRNGTTLSLMTNLASACNITMVGFELGYTVVRGC